MKASEALKDVPFETNLKVGCKLGNGYFYCGTVGDFLDHIKEYSDILFDHAKERYNKSKDISDKAITLFCSDIFAKMKDDAFTDKYLESIEPCFERISRYINTTKNAKKRIDSFKPLKDREVIDVFRADRASENAECLVLIVSGSERGKFWTLDEAKDEKIAFNNPAESFSYKV